MNPATGGVSMGAIIWAEKIGHDALHRSDVSDYVDVEQTLEDMGARR